ANRSVTDDIAGGVFHSLVFSSANGAGYTISGNDFALNPATGSISVNTQTAVSISNNIAVGLNTISIPAGGQLTLSGQLTGAANATLTQTGNVQAPGIFTLAGDNSGYQGAITVESNAGTLAISTPTALGTITKGTVIGVNSSLDVLDGAGTVSEPLTLNGIGTDGQGALFNVSGNNTWAGSIVLDSSNGSTGVVIGAGLWTPPPLPPGPPASPPPPPPPPPTATRSVLTITGIISDNGSGENLTKEGAGEVQLEAANTYRGTTFVNNGILTVGNALALGAATNQPGAANFIFVNSATTEQGQLRLASAGSGF